MSEHQKIFTSLSGAVVAHLLLLVVIFLFLSANRSESSNPAGNPSVPEPPKEITILMGDLMKTVEVEKSGLSSRDFVSTDLNEDEANAPEKARFESDRNTRAASEWKPDEILPREKGPTLVGSSEAEQFTLQDRRFSDGVVDRSATQSRMPEATPTPQAAQEATQQGQVGDSTLLSRSYIDPSADNSAYRIGEMSTKPEELINEGSGATKTIPADDADTLPDGFRSEERQTAVNGSEVRQGRNAVDAEATAMGRYKKAVKDAIAVKWHSFRKEQADLVTWGTLKLQFQVASSGEVRNVKITKNEANKVLVNFTLKAITEADLPAMPTEVSEELGDEDLIIRYEIIIY